MKQIELTKEHKSKLLEMCQILFPEYDFTLDKFEQCFVTLGLKSEILYKEHIHWFEFCITKLWLKIAFYVNHEPTAIRSIILEKVHPVDYLYEEFKKIKL